MNSNDKGKAVSYSTSQDIPDPNASALALDTVSHPPALPPNEPSSNSTSVATGSLVARDSRAAHEPDLASNSKSTTNDGPVITPDIRLDVVEEILKGEETDYERILGVPRAATQKEKHKAYKDMLKYIHPDHHPQSKSQAQQACNLLETAYNALKDPNAPEIEYGASWAPGAYGSGDDDSDNESNSHEGGYEKKKKDLTTEQRKGKGIQTMLDRMNVLITQSQPRTAPSGILEIYDKVTEDMEEFLRNPDDEEALGKLKAAQQSTLDQDQSFLLDVGLICGLARDIRSRRTQLRTNPEDIYEMTSYAHSFCTFEHEKQYKNWPSTWYLDRDPEAARILYCALANPHVEALKKDPHSLDPETTLRQIEGWIDHWCQEARVASVYMLNVSAFRKYHFRLAEAMPGSEDYDKHHRDLESYIVKHGFPKSWATPPPTSVNEKDGRATGSGPVRTTGPNGGPAKNHFPLSSVDKGDGGPPTARDGAIICGHRHWKVGKNDAYLFAVLPNPEVPIGELRPTKRLGHDSKETYLSSNAINELKKKGKEDPDSFQTRFQTRFQEAVAVFVHTSRPAKKAPETWVMALMADGSGEELQNIEYALYTRTNYILLRKGIDAEYDIAKIFADHQRTPPGRLRSILPSIHGKFNEYKSKTNEPSLGPPRFAENAEAQGTREAELEELIAELRRSTSTAGQAPSLQSNPPVSPMNAVPFMNAKFNEYKSKTNEPSLGPPRIAENAHAQGTHEAELEELIAEIRRSTSTAGQAPSLQPNPPVSPMNAVPSMNAGASTNTMPPPNSETSVNAMMEIMKNQRSQIDHLTHLVSQMAGMSTRST